MGSCSITSCWPVPEVPRRLWGPSVGYADSSEPLCLPVLVHVPPRPCAAATGAVALVGTSVSWLVSKWADLVILINTLSCNGSGWL